MLTALKNKHIKWILWALVIIIVPAFVFFGAASLSSKKQNTLASIKNHPVTIQEFKKYLDLARIDMLVNSGERHPKNINTPVMEQQAWQYYILLWKAEQEKITVSDKEVVKSLHNDIFGKGRFDPRAYQHFVKYRLRVSPRSFEEYLRKKLIIGRLFENEVKTEVSEEEILTAYKKDNEKAKIAYILIPFDRTETELQITEEQINSFYQKNKEQFKEEPKVKINYIYVSEEKYLNHKELLENVLAEAETISDIAEAVPEISLKESDFLSVRSPIEGIGWEPEVLKQAFNLELNELSPLIKIHNGYLIYTKLGQRKARIPEAEEIKDLLTEKVKEQETKKAALEKGRSILNDAEEKNITSLESLAKTFKYEYKETDFFKYFDYIEGVGLNEDLSKAVFSAEKGALIPEAYNMPKGVYIVQLIDLQLIDEAKFTDEKNSYKEKLLTQKSFIERINYMQEIAREADLKVFNSVFQ